MSMGDGVKVERRGVWNALGARAGSAISEWRYLNPQMVAGLEKKETNLSMARTETNNKSRNVLKSKFKFAYINIP